jgi:hypothetical protein
MSTFAPVGGNQEFRSAPNVRCALVLCRIRRNVDGSPSSLVECWLPFVAAAGLAEAVPEKEEELMEMADSSLRA